MMMMNDIWLMLLLERMDAIRSTTETAQLKDGTREQTYNNGCILLYQSYFTHNDANKQIVHQAASWLC